MTITTSFRFVFIATVWTLSFALQYYPLNPSAIQRYTGPRVQLARGLPQVGFAPLQMANVPRKMAPFPQLATRVTVPGVAAAVHAVHFPRPVMVNAAGVQLATAQMAYSASRQRRKDVTKKLTAVVKQLRAANTLQNLNRPQLAVQVAPGKVQFATQDITMSSDLQGLAQQLKETVDTLRNMMQMEVAANPRPASQSSPGTLVLASTLGDVVKLVQDVLTFDWLTEEVLEFLEFLFELILEILEAILEFKEEGKVK